LNPKEYELKQHFLGWEVEFDEEVLDPGVVDLMDFRMDQCDEVRFIYILPFSKKHGLIEMTIFSEEVFESKKQYEELLEDYLNSHFRNQKYRIIDTEYGIIPMSTHAYMGRNQDKIIPIGNLSGRIKPSSGYAFTRIQEEVKQIAKDLKTNNKRIGLDNQNRFLFYDRILFNVITRKRMLGADIFTRLFERNESVRVLTFLGEKTTLWQEIRIFNSLPFFPFFKAMLSEVIRRILYK